MRIFKELFIEHTSEDNSSFYIFYSNNTYTSGLVKRVDGSDGSRVNNLNVVKDSIINGSYLSSAENLILTTEHTGKTSWKKVEGKESYQFGERTIFKFTNHTLAEEFLIHNQKDYFEVEPVKHDYVRLNHKGDNVEKYFAINWFLGNTCSYSCSYCPSYLNDGSIPWMDIRILKKFIDKLYELITDKIIVFEFTGGEVTIYKDYAELCSYIKNKGGVISMISNGSRTMDWWRKNVHNFDQITLSYHTEEAKRDHYLELVELLKDNVDLSVNIMTPPGKVDFCVQLGLDAKAIKDCAVHLMPIIEDLEGELLEEYTKEELDIINNFNLTSDEFSTYTKTNWLNFRGEMLKETINGDSTRIMEPTLVANKENSWLGWDCYSGVTQLIIDATGDIYRGWCFVGGKIGNIANPNISLPNVPVLCNKELCHCNFDMFSIKESTDYKNKIKAKEKITL